MLRATALTHPQHEFHAPAINFDVSPGLHRFDTSPGAFPQKWMGQKTATATYDYRLGASGGAAWGFVLTRFIIRPRLPAAPLTAPSR